MLHKYIDERPREAEKGKTGFETLNSHVAKVTELSKQFMQARKEQKTLIDNNLKWAQLLHSRLVELEKEINSLPEPKPHDPNLLLEDWKIIIENFNTLKRIVESQFKSANDSHRNDEKLGKVYVEQCKTRVAEHFAVIDGSVKASTPAKVPASAPAPIAPQQISLAPTLSAPSAPASRSGTASLMLGFAAEQKAKSGFDSHEYLYVKDGVS